MKLKELSIDNFKNIKSLKLPLDKPITILSGPDGSGKSAIRQALSTIITGKTPTSPSEEYINKDSTKANLSLTCTLSETERELSRQITKEKSRSTSDITQDKMLSELGVKMNLVEIALDTWAVSALTKEDRITLLRSVLGSAITIQEAEQKIRDLNLGSEKQVNDFLANITTDYKSSSKPVEEFIENRAISYRRTNKSSMDDLMAKLVLVDAEILELESQIKTLTAKSESSGDTEAIQKQVIDIQNKIQTNWDNKSQSTVRLNGAKNNLTKIDAKLTEIGVKDEVIKKTLEDLDTAVKALTNKKSLSESAVRGLTASIESIKNCSTSTDIKCAYLGSCKYDKIVDELPVAEKDMKEKLLRKQKELEETIKLLGVATEEKTWLENYNTLINLKNTAQQIIDTETKLSDELTQSFNQLNIDKHELQKQIGAEVSELAEKNTKLSEHRGSRSTLIENIESNNSFITLMKKIEALKSEGAISGNISNAAKASLVLNLELLFPETGGWEVSPDGDLELGGVPMRTLSTSQSFRLGAAVQLTAAEHSGIGIAIIDGINIITNQNTIANMIRIASDKCEQGKISHVIFTTSDEEFPYSTYKLDNYNLVKVKELLGKKSE